MILPKILKFSLNFLSLITNGFYYLSIAFCGLCGIGFFASILGLIFQEITFTQFLSGLVPYGVGILFMAILTYIKYELNTTAQIFSNIQDQNRETLLRKESSAKRNILNFNTELKKLENKEVQLKKSLKELNTKIEENYKKHQHWISVKVPKIREEKMLSLKAELDTYSLEYATQKLKERQKIEREQEFEENFGFTSLKNKKNGTSH